MQQVVYFNLDLRLSDNNISNLPPLTELMSVEQLQLNNNQITDLSPLAELIDVQVLFLNGNGISNVLPLTKLTNLIAVFLIDNPLNTPSYCGGLQAIIANNPGLGALQFDANPNPLTLDCSISLAELIVFAGHWLESGCGVAGNWCGGADMIHSGFVGMENFVELSHYY
ncbi:MAG: hypothetical protein IID32_07980 [Planctomycetes bacterium]|nr:hypothetical protein [Planctomycetota bacterium]